MFGGDFITVNKKEEYTWEEVNPVCLECKPLYCLALPPRTRALMCYMPPLGGVTLVRC